MSHAGVQVRVFLDSVGEIAPGSPSRAYSLRLDGDTCTFTGALGKVTGPCGILGLEATQGMSGHSASIEILMGGLGAVLRPLVECQDALRIELNTGNGWECVFDGFVGGVSCSKSSTASGFSWRLSLSAEGIQRLWSQLWANWRATLTAGDADWLQKAGIALQDSLCNLTGFYPPSVVIHLLLKYGVSNLMDVSVRGNPLGMAELDQAGYWQTGKEVAAALRSYSADPNPNRYWNDAFGLNLVSSIPLALTREGSLWSIIQGFMEPDLHEFFVTYLPSAADPSTQIPTLVFRPQPFPGGPASGGAIGGSDAPRSSYREDSGEWNALAPDALVMGQNGAPGPLSVSSSKNDSDRANAFFWSMMSGNDSDQGSFMGKCSAGFWADRNSILRYGFSSHQFSTALAPRDALKDWWSVTIPKALRRVAFQTHPLPFLWNQNRVYPCTPHARIGTPLLDATDAVCGYITQVSHRVNSTPNGFKAATTLTVGRVVEGVTSVADYPEAVWAFSQFLKWDTFLHSDGVNRALGVVPPVAAPTPASRGGIAVPPSNIPRAPGEKRIFPAKIPMVAGEGPEFPRKCGGDHNARDFIVPQGTALFAPCDGTFLHYEDQFAGGNVIRFLGKDGLTTHTFAHLSDVNPIFTQSANTRLPLVAGVTLLGHSGGAKGLPGSGFSTTGAHLHWSILGPHKEIVDPLEWLS